MKRSLELTSRTYALLAVMVILGPAGNVLLSTGMRGAASTQWTVSNMSDMAAGVVGSGTIWLGLACLLAYLIAEMAVLSWADYTYVQPASAASYGIVALLGYAVLGEDVSRMRWLGVAVICLGVLLVGRTPHRTTEAPPS